MKKGLLTMMMLSAAIDLVNNEGYSRYMSKRKGMNPDYRRPSINKEVKEFDINGVKVLAYSRKDAIKRIKHLKGR